jgi:hypothetical protein
MPVGVRVLARLRRETAGSRPVGVSHDEQAEHDKAELHDRSGLCAPERATLTLRKRLSGRKLLFERLRSADALYRRSRAE